MKKYLDESLSAQERAESLVDEMTIEEQISQLNYKAPATFRLITGGMRACTDWHVQGQRQCFRRQ